MENTYENRSLEPTPQAEDFTARIPEGRYDATCYKFETGVSFGGVRKIYIKFRIYGGDFDGVDLFMVCTYPKTKIRPRFKYYTQWILATGRHPSKRERLSPKVFLNKMYRVIVRDTDPKFPDGKSKPDIFKHSIIDSLIEVLAGKDV